MRTVLLALSILALSFYLLKYQEESGPWLKKSQAETVDRMTQAATAPNRLSDWPPQLGKIFPSVELIDHRGHPFALGSLKGKPTIIEFVAMTCAGCQGFSGGNIYGGFKGFAVQPGLPSFEAITKTYGGIDLYSEKLHYVQLVIYNLSLDPPSAIDLSTWREHFHFDKHPNTTVVGGTAALANKDSFAMIPGFMLIDSDQNVCFDATGHNPKHDLYRTLVPSIKRVVDTGQCP
jgi:hypothetical protein